MSNSFNQLVDFLCEIYENPTNLGQSMMRGIASKAGKIGAKVAGAGLQAAGFAAGVPLPNVGDKLVGAYSTIQGARDEVSKNRRASGIEPSVYKPLDDYIASSIDQKKLIGVSSIEESREKIFNALVTRYQKAVSSFTYSIASARGSTAVNRKHTLDTMTLNGIYTRGSADTKLLIENLERDGYISSRTISTREFLELLRSLYFSFKDGKEIEKRTSPTPTRSRVGSRIRRA